MTEPRLPLKVERTKRSAPGFNHKAFTTKQAQIALSEYDEPVEAENKPARDATILMSYALSLHSIVPIDLSAYFEKVREALK